MVQLKITPNLTCNNKPIDLERGVWFEVAADEGKKVGTHSKFKTPSFTEALEWYREIETEHTKFIDVWAFPIGDDIPYPIDQFAFKDK